MAETARTLITNALLDLGVLADGETPTPAQANGALRKLNNMADSWNLENLLSASATQTVFPLTANKSTYTLGSGGDFSMPRPTTVTAAYYRDTNQPANLRQDIPLYMMSLAEYQDTPFKGMANLGPYGGIYIDPTFPLSTVYIVPAPSTNQYSLVLWTGSILTNLTLDSVITLQPGYIRALESNLAIEVAVSYGIEPPAAMVQIASNSLDWLRQKNLNLKELQTGYGMYDIYSDSYQGR